MKNIHNTSIKTKVLIALAIASLMVTSVSEAGYWWYGVYYPTCGWGSWGWVCG